MDQEIADNTAALKMAQGEEPSKNARKKADKQKKLAEEKANKSTTDTAKESAKPEGKKLAKNKPQGPELKSITADKATDFASWYSETLLKGEFFDYYDISGCYILKVCGAQSTWAHIH